MSPRPTAPRLSRLLRAAGLALALPLAALTAGRAGAEPPPRHPATITVTGEGRVSTRPDLATVTLGVETVGQSANTALAENSAATARVMEELKAAGISGRDMQTSNLTLGPRWDQAEGQPARISGFVAANMVTVTVRDLQKLGGVLDAVARNGANSFQGLSFGLADPRPREDEARRAAVADALVRAKLYADAAGVTLGPILSLAEGGDRAPRPMMRMAADAASVALAEGEVDIAASVTAEFAIEP